jgi:hypothetical protein
MLLELDAATGRRPRLVLQRYFVTAQRGTVDVMRPSPDDPKVWTTEGLESAWEAAIDGKGQVRERRADDACGNQRCAHRECWIEEAHVAELTGLLREGPAGDLLKGWPKTMRVFARRERPHQGAQLSLFEAADGWRYSLWVTNLPAATRGWRGQCDCIDAAHRGCAPRRGRSAPGRTPAWDISPRLRAEQGVARRRHDRLHPAVLAEVPGPGRRPRPGRAEEAALPRPARWRPARPRRAPKNPENRRHLALGKEIVTAWQRVQAIPHPT